jgi:uncharacterized membrane protein
VSDAPVAGGDRPLAYEPPAGVRRLEKAVAVVLRIGVAVSSALLLVGTVVTITASATSGQARRTVAALRAGAAHPGGLAIARNVGDVAHGLRHLQGPDVVILGVAVLVLTPIARVAVSLAVYAAERDGRFVAITAVVLAMLLASFALG